MSHNQYQQNQAANPYAYDQIAAHASVSDRVRFIRNTYLHLTGAVLALVALETLLFTVFGDAIGKYVMPMISGGYGWLVVLGMFMGVSWIANSWAHSNTSRGMQYAGLGLYVVAEAIILLPLIWIASNVAPGSIGAAAVVTGIIFTGLTAVVFVTKADFSFLRMAISIGCFAAIAAIVVSIVFSGVGLGPWFSIAMIVLVSACILYSTSNVLHHYNTSQHVAASLALFASLATLFWYVLQLFMSQE